MKRLLLVEPDRLQAGAYQAVLSDDFDVRWVRTTQGAISAMDRKKFDLIVSETSLDHHNGIELLSEIRAYEDWANIPMVFLSSIPGERFPIPSRTWSKYGVLAFLNKARTRPTKLRDFLTSLSL